MIDDILVSGQIGFELESLAADVAFVGPGVRVDSGVRVQLPVGAEPACLEEIRMMGGKGRNKQVGRRILFTVIK